MWYAVLTIWPFVPCLAKYLYKNVLATLIFNPLEFPEFATYKLLKALSNTSCRAPSLFVNVKSKVFAYWYLPEMLHTPSSGPCSPTSSRFAFRITFELVITSFGHCEPVPICSIVHLQRKACFRRGWRLLLANFEMFRFRTLKLSLSRSLFVVIINSQRLTYS